LQTLAQQAAALARKGPFTFTAGARIKPEILNGPARAMQRSPVRVVSALLAVGAAEAFYLPGVAPREYATGEKVELKVNKLTSTKTQV
jgi:hypothetical protein